MVPSKPNRCLIPALLVMFLAYPAWPQHSGGSATAEDAHLSLLGKVANLQGQGYIPGRVILGLTGETNIQETATMVESLGASVIKTLSSINAVVVELPDPGLDMTDIVDLWANQPGVRYAQPDYAQYVGAAVPNDALFFAQWGLHNTGQTGGTPDADMDGPEAWDAFTGDSDVVLAANEFYSHSYEVTVSDGQLTLELRPLNGAPVALINALVIEKGAGQIQPRPE